MVTGTSVAYVGGTTHRPLPKAGDRVYSSSHTPTRPRATGLDWDALRPRCRACGEQSSQVGPGELCPGCTPAPTTPEPPAAATSTPAAAGPKPRRPRPTAKPARQRAPRERKPRPAPAPKGPSAYRLAKNELEANIVRDYQAGGVLVSELAEKYDVSRMKVRRTLDAHGVERVDERTLRSGGKPRNYDPAVMEEVRRLYVDQQLSRTQVAERLGLPYKTVVTIMGRLGIEARQHQSGRLDGAAPLKERIAALGVTAREIKEWGVREGHLMEMQVGIPPARLVDAYVAAHPHLEGNVDV